MKVILSRKGFDSSYGGYPSPILPDGTLVSLPIPSIEDKIRYSDLSLSKSLSYYDVMTQLKSIINIPGLGKIKLEKNIECHLDPDLNMKTFERNNHWKPSFGQINQAQSHLENQNITKGDLFLFFGWFKQTEYIDSKLRYQKDARDLHLIYGYLQIGEIFKINAKSRIPKWLQYHPHASNKERLENNSNVIYIAKNKLSWNEKINGAGVLNYCEKNVLTKKNETRSIWELPSFFRNLHITYHSEKSWNEDGSLNATRRGQEFVVEENKLVERWARSIIEKN